ncbi:unnamed protein product [Enterobius vermicularis]|uniref:Uncharacterized protein n=1 Tax=Enterobius vermicularis TaxID=51028 RepID=A0A0N4UTM9_ENTVE|nr:unnamed protein product [Enterobius vermicularis]
MAEWAGFSVFVELRGGWLVGRSLCICAGAPRYSNGSAGGGGGRPRERGFDKSSSVVSASLLALFPWSILLCICGTDGWQ